jgi:hypothetical protein
MAGMIHQEGWSGCPEAEEVAEQHAAPSFAVEGDGGDSGRVPAVP